MNQCYILRYQLHKVDCKKNAPFHQNNKAGLSSKVCYRSHSWTPVYDVTVFDVSVLRIDYYSSPHPFHKLFYFVDTFTSAGQPLSTEQKFLVQFNDFFWNLLNCNVFKLKQLNLHFVTSLKKANFDAMLKHDNHVSAKLCRRVIKPHNPIVWMDFSIAL